MKKPIVISWHARLQMQFRGAEETEVIEAARKGQWQPAKRGRFQAKWRFIFDKPSPITGVIYRFKEIEVIFAEESDEIIVLTVKVYYTNEGEKP
ncbi:MAG: hypothetical protein COS88_05835 [Chloroflexi bacterium CG07_land_8_20_14_0_80_51_10]|nr:MAG: hypothetical protein COS88_05835 [Chloroflexi bacterium CG07_land_8_20_14_0_80_51_10]